MKSALLTLLLHFELLEHMQIIYAKDTTYVTNPIKLTFTHIYTFVIQRKIANYVALKIYILSVHAFGVN